MSLTSAIAIYFVLWWIVLFAVLPWGVRTQEEAGDVAPGTESSAPTRTNLKWKFLITSGITALILLCFEVAIRAGLTLDSIPLLPKF